MAALAVLDERQKEVQVFVSPLGDQSTKVNAETEAAAFVARPDPLREAEATPVIIDANSGSNRQSAFAEAAGLYL
ncbi:hypothetical protein G6F52_014250 [Rhizopus delemar]|nr:hypothetical protein G6F52_014250 [Rhizopus delemar]